uniref:Uncharacterized protein n=1 Tax=Arundo donax TaxID=35708 RepID=A0A0A9AIB5_ARUDO
MPLQQGRLPPREHVCNLVDNRLKICLCKLADREREPQVLAGKRRHRAW